MRVNTNISAILANSYLRRNDDLVSKSMEKLSSGKKLNRSSDDSAGMAISSKMRTQIRGLNQANQNASDGQSVIQTAEGALNEVEAILQRMRELCVQGANSTYGDEEREAISEEIGALQEEITRIAKDTEFNNKTLLDGNFDRRRYTDVQGVEVSSLSEYVEAGQYSIYITEVGKQAGASIPIHAGDGAVVGEDCKIRLNDYEIEIKKTDTVADVKAKITTAADKLNLTVEYDVDPITGDDVMLLTTLEYGSSAEISYSCTSSGFNNGYFGFGLAETTVSGTDIKASFVNPDPAAPGGREGFNNTAVLTTKGNTVTITDNGGFSMEYKLDSDQFPGLDPSAAAGVPDFKKVTAEVKDIGMMTIHVGANEGQIMDVNIPKVSLETLGLDLINTNTRVGCGKAITSADKAISVISSIRSSLGAYQNRMDSTIANLSVSEENMTTAISRIEDTDMAAEMTEYTKLTVLTQAATAMVAQANERPQTVLQLLQ